MTMTDRVVLITGGSSGIGAETARQVVAAGGRVVLGARRLDRLRELQEELGPDSAAIEEVDVTSDADVKKLIATAEERFGRLDVVFANAGFGGGGSIAAGEPEVWREMLLTNVYGAAITVRYAIDLLLRSPAPQIVLTSSVAGQIVRAEGNQMYAATKFAVEAIGDGLRKDLTGRVRVTLVEPGAVDTEFQDWPGKVLEAEDIARLVVFAIEQPEHVAINQLMVRPIGQEM